MGKEIDSIYKYSQSQLSTPPIKEPVFASSASQTPSSIKLTIACVSSIIDKEQTDYVFCSQNTTQDYLNITNNNGIHSYKTPRKKLFYSKSFN